VIPALGMVAEATTPEAQRSSGQPSKQKNAEPMTAGLTPASAGPATPATNFQGLSGDTSWTRHRDDGARRATSAERGAPTNGADRAPANAGRSAGGRGANGSAAPNPNAPKFNPYADDDAPPTPGRRK